MFEWARGPTFLLAKRKPGLQADHVHSRDPAARIEALIAPLVAGMGYELVRVKFLSGAKARLQVMAERADGSMDVEDCATLSRAISALLDVEDPVPSEYILEVSSPGIDRPLTRLGDFTRFEGHEARIELQRMLEGRKRFRGVLNGVDGETVLLTDEAGTLHRLPFALIDEAKLVLTDALIAESMKAQGQGWGGQNKDGPAGAQQGQMLDLEASGEAIDIEVDRKPRGSARRGAKPRTTPKTRLN